MNTKRILAHRIVLNGHTYKMAILTVSEQADGKWRVNVSPFSEETAATTFHSGTVAVNNSKGTPWKNGDRDEPNLQLL